VRVPFKRNTAQKLIPYAFIHSSKIWQRINLESKNKTKLTSLALLPAFIFDKQKFQRRMRKNTNPHFQLLLFLHSYARLSNFVTASSIFGPPIIFHGSQFPPYWRARHTPHIPLYALPQFSIQSNKEYVRGNRLGNFTEMYGWKLRAANANPINKGKCQNYWHRKCGFFAWVNVEGMGRCLPTLKKNWMCEERQNWQRQRPNNIWLGGKGNTADGTHFKTNVRNQNMAAAFSLLMAFGRRNLNECVCAISIRCTFPSFYIILANISWD